MSQSRVHGPSEDRSHRKTIVKEAASAAAALVNQPRPGQAVVEVVEVSAASKHHDKSRFADMLGNDSDGSSSDSAQSDETQMKIQASRLKLASRRTSRSQRQVSGRDPSMASCSRGTRSHASSASAKGKMPQNGKAQKGSTFAEQDIPLAIRKWMPRGALRKAGMLATVERTKPAQGSIAQRSSASPKPKSVLDMKMSIKQEPPEENNHDSSSLPVPSSSAGQLTPDCTVRVTQEDFRTAQEAVRSAAKSQQSKLIVAAEKSEDGMLRSEPDPNLQTGGHLDFSIRALKKDLASSREYHADADDTSSTGTSSNVGHDQESRHAVLCPSAAAASWERTAAGNTGCSPDDTNCRQIKTEPPDPDVLPATSSPCPMHRPSNPTTSASSSARKRRLSALENDSTSGHSTDASDREMGRVQTQTRVATRKRSKVCCFACLSRGSADAELQVSPYKDGPASRVQDQSGATTAGERQQCSRCGSHVATNPGHDPSFPKLRSDFLKASHCMTMTSAMRRAQRERVTRYPHQVLRYWYKASWKRRGNWRLSSKNTYLLRQLLHKSSKLRRKPSIEDIVKKIYNSIPMTDKSQILTAPDKPVAESGSDGVRSPSNAVGGTEHSLEATERSTHVGSQESSPTSDAASAVSMSSTGALPGELSPQPSLLSGPASVQQTQCVKDREKSLESCTTSSSQTTTTETLKTNTDSNRHGNNKNCEKDSMNVTVGIESERVKKSFSIGTGPKDGLETSCAKSLGNLPTAQLSKTVNEDENSDKTRAALEDQESPITEQSSKRDPAINTKTREDKSSNEARNVSCQSQDVCSTGDAFPEPPKASPPSDLVSEEEPYSPSEWKEDLPKSLVFNVSAGLLEEYGEKVLAEHTGAIGKVTDSPTQEEDVLEAKTSAKCKEIPVKQDNTNEKVSDMTVETKLSSKAQGCMMTEKTSVGCEGKLQSTEAIDMKSQQSPEKNEVMEGTKDLVGKSAGISVYTGITEKPDTSFHEDVSESKGSGTTDEAPGKCERTLLSASVSDTESSAFGKGKEDLDSVMTDKVSTKSSNFALISLEVSEIDVNMFSEEDDSRCQEQDTADGTSMQCEGDEALCMEACNDESDGFPEKDVEYTDPEVTSASEKDNSSCHASSKEDSSDYQLSDAHESTEFSDLDKSSCEARERMDEDDTVLIPAAVAGSNVSPVAKPTQKAAENKLMSTDKVPPLQNTLPSATSESMLKGRVKSRIPVRVRGHMKNQGTPPSCVPKEQPPNSSRDKTRSQESMLPSSVLPHDSGNFPSEFCRQEKVAEREKDRAQRRAEVKKYLKKRRMTMKKLLFGSVKSEMHLRKKSNHKSDEEDEGHGIDPQKQAETIAKGSESRISPEDYGKDAWNLTKDQHCSRKHGAQPETKIRRDRKLAKDAVSCHREETSRGISQVLEKPTVKKTCLSTAKSVGHDSLHEDESSDRKKEQCSTCSVIVTRARMTGLDTEGSHHGFQTPMEFQSRSVHPRLKENPFIYDQSSSDEHTDFRPPSGCCTSDEQTSSQEPQELQKWHSSSESLQEDDPLTRCRVLQADPLAVTSPHSPGTKSTLVTGSEYLEHQPESPVRLTQVKKRLFWNRSVSDSMGKVLNEEPVQKFRRLETDCQNASESLGVHMDFPGYPSIDRELEYKSEVGGCGSSSSFLNGIPSSHETMSLTFSSPQEQQEAVSSLMSFVDTLPPADSSADLEDDTMSSSLPSCSMPLPLAAGPGTGRTGSLGLYTTAQPVEQTPYGSLHLSGVNQLQANCSQNSYPCSSVPSQRRAEQDFATKFYSAQSYPYLASSECSPHAFMYPPVAGPPHTAAQEMMMMMNIQSTASESLQDLYARTMSLAMMLSHFLPQGNQQMHGHSGNGIPTPAPGSTSTPRSCSPGVPPPTELCKDATMPCTHAAQHHALPGKRMPEDRHHQASHMGRFSASNVRQVEKMGFQECASKSVGGSQDGTPKIRNLRKLVKQETCTDELDNCATADGRDSQMSPLVSRKFSEVLEPSPSISDQSSRSVTPCSSSGLEKLASSDHLRAAVPKLPKSSTSSSARTGPSDTSGSRDRNSRAGGAPGQARGRHTPRWSPSPVDCRLQCACNTVSGPIMVCVPLPPNALTASPHDSGISSSEGSACDFLHEAVQSEGAGNDINPRMVLHKLPDGEWEVRSDSSHKSPTQDESLLTDTEDEDSNIQQGNDSSKNEKQTPEESINDLATGRKLWKISTPTHSSTENSRPGLNPRMSPMGNFESSSLRKEKSMKPCNALKQEKMKDEKLTSQPRRVRNPACFSSSIVEIVKPEPPGLPNQQHDSHNAKGSLRKKAGEGQSGGSAAMTGDMCKKKKQDHTGQKAPKKCQSESRTSTSSQEVGSSPTTEFEKAILTSQSKQSLPQRKNGCDKKEQCKRPLENEHSSRNFKEVLPTGKKSKSSDEHTVRKPCEPKVASKCRELSLERNASGGKAMDHSGSGCKKRKSVSGECSPALKSEKENGKGKRGDWYSLMEKALNNSIVDEENLGPSDFSRSTLNRSPKAALSSSISPAPKQSSERKTCESRNIKGRSTDGSQSGKARVFGLGRIIDCSASQGESSGSEESTSSDGENSAPQHSTRINHSQGNAPVDTKVKKGKGETKDTCSRPVSPCHSQRSETLACRGSSELDDGMKIVSDKIRLRKIFGCSSSTITMPKPAIITTISPDCGDSRLVVLVKRSHSHQQSNDETSSMDCSMSHSISEAKQPKRGARKRKGSTPSAHPITDEAATSVSTAVKNAKHRTVTLEEGKSPEQDAGKESALEKKKQIKSKKCPHTTKNDHRSTKVGPKCTKEMEEKMKKNENKVVATKHGDLLDDLFGSSSDLDAEFSVAESQQQNLPRNCKTPDHVSDKEEWENSMNCNDNEECDDELFGKSETREARSAVASKEIYTEDVCQSEKSMAPNEILTTGLASNGNRCTQEKATRSQEAMDEINAAVASILEDSSMLVEPLISPLAESPVACRRSSQDDGQENSSSRLLDDPEPLPSREEGNKGKFSKQSWQNDKDDASDSDVLSLYAPSDASFLDDDIDDKVEEEPRLNHTKLDTKSPKAKPQVVFGTAPSEHSHKAASKKVKAPDPDVNTGGRMREAASPHLDSAQAEEACPSMTAQEPTEEGELSGADQDQPSDMEVDQADTQETEPVVLKVWSPQCRMAIPDGYCFSFVLHDRCSKSSCPYRHAKPSTGEMCLKLVNKINFHCQHREPLSAMECYRVMQSEKLGKLEAPELLMLFYSCLHSGLPQPAFQLVSALRALSLITAEVCTAFLRTCLPFSLRHAQLMWRMFEEMSALSLFPAPDALAGLLRSFYELEDVGRLVPMLNYSRGCPRVKLPTYVVEWTMREVAAKGSLALCRQASQWLHSAQPSDLATINCQILKALTERYKAHNLLSTSAVLEKALWNSTQGGQEEEEEGSGSGEVAAAMSPVHPDLDEMDPKEVKSWVQRIKQGSQASRDLQHLASVFLELCDEGSLWPAHFVPAFLESLTDVKDSDRTIHNLKVFIHMVLVEYSRQQPVNVLLSLDRTSLSRIGGSLCVKLHKAELWGGALDVLTTLRQAALPLGLGSLDLSPTTTALAMLDTCLHAQDHSGLACQLLQDCSSALSGDMEAEEGSRLLQILHGLVAMEIKGAKDFGRALELLTFALSRLQWEADESREGWVPHINVAVMGALGVGEVGCAVRCLDLYLQHLLPPTPPAVLHPDPLRALLAACDLYGLKDKVSTLLQLGKKLCYYPDFAIAPCVDVLPLRSFWTRAEVRAVLCDHLENLYHYLCNKLVDRLPLTQADLVMVCRTHVMWPPQQVSLPYVSASPRNPSDAQELLLSVLTKDLSPALPASVSGDGHVIIMPASLEKFLQALDRRGRRLGLVFRPGLAIPAMPSLPLPTPPALPPKDRGAKGRGTPHGRLGL